MSIVSQKSVCYCSESVAAMLSRNPESYDVVRYITFIYLNGYEK